MNRIITGVIGLAMAGLAPLATASTATAATGHEPAAGRTGTASTTAPRESLPPREITSKMVKVSAHKIVFKGKVKGAPKYANKIVRIERRVGKGGSWKLYQKVRSTDLGNWKCQVGAPRTGKWYFRAVTPKTNNYRKSYSDVWYTYTM
ncbi:hypothetical protein [Nocardioides koreensis]